MEDEGILSTGTRLGEFEIRGLVGIGGFGIVYRAFDHDLEREVAIKEYMPGLLASRTADGGVQPRGRTHAETFDAGLRSFMLEAKMLARFDHPALVKVFRYWEGNGTAYMVMPLYLGQTLGHALKQMGTPPTEAWLMGVLVPLLGALETLHAQQIYHRDVSPDNVLLLRNGRPVLLDFGAARQVISDRTQTLTAILKPNYAPIEQYAEVPNLRQGPWTDLYALGAVVHFSLTGKPPPPAAARTVQDDMVPLAEAAARLEAEHGLHYSAAFLDAWQQTLAVRPGERPQSVRELMQRLGLMPGSAGFDGDTTVMGAALGGHGPDGDRTVVVTGQTLSHRTATPTRTPTQIPTSPAQAAPAATTGTPTLSPRTMSPRTGTTAPTGRDMRIVPPGSTQAAAPAPAPERPQPATMTAAASPATPASAPPPAPPSGQGKWIAIGAGVLVLGAAAAWFSGRGGPAQAPVVPPAASAASEAAVAASAASAPRTAPPMITEYPDPPASAAAATSPAVQAANAASAAAAATAASKAAERAALQAAKASAAAAAKAAAASAAAANAVTPAARPAPAPAPERNAPASAPRPASQAAPAEPVRPSAPAAPRSPEESCGKRVFLARDMCIQEACHQAEFARHPTCVDLRRRADEERRREMYGG